MGPGHSIVFLVLLGLLVYGNALFNALIWDDEERILNNPLLRDPANWWVIVTGASAVTGGGQVGDGFFRPLYALWNLGQYTLWGSAAWGYHLAQLLLHLTNVVLVFGVLQRLNPAPLSLQADIQLPIPARVALPLAINTLIAAWFAIHAAIAEAVVYPAAGEVPYVTLVLSALYLMISTRKSRALPIRVVLFVTCLLAAVLYKESAFVLLPALGVYLVLYRPAGWAFWAGGMGLAAAIYIGLRLAIVRSMVPTGGGFQVLSPAAFMAAPIDAWNYAGLLVFPHQLAAGRLFSVDPLSVQGYLLPVSGLVLACGALLLAAWRARSRLAWFGVAWATICLAWASTPYPPDITIAERWLYAPLIGVVFALAGGLTRLLAKRPAWALPCLAVLSVTIGLMGARTFMRTFDWRDGLTLYRSDVSHPQASFYIHHNLGVELMRRGHTREAKARFIKSLELNPHYSIAYNNLGAVFERERDFESARQAYERSLEIRKYHLSYQNLAALVLFRFKEPDRARQVSQEGISAYPYNGELWLLLALSEHARGDNEAAMRAAQRSHELGPNERNALVFSRLAQGIPIPLDYPN